MRIGKLRHRVQIQIDIGTQEGTLGEPIPNWQTSVSRWASIEPLEGREAFLARQQFAQIPVKFRLRPVPGLAAKMRLRLSDGRTFNIESVANLEERDREYEVLAVENV